MAYLWSIIKLNIKMTEYFNLNKKEISKELSVNKFNKILDSQGRQAPMATKASPVTSYSKVTQRR